MKIGKFNIGDTVKVIKPGMTYEHYDHKFRELGFKNTVENTQFSSNTYAEVFAVTNHDNPHHTEPLVAIRDDSTGDECLIAESGIEIVSLSLKEFEAEFDLTTDEGRLAYAKKYYPIGTRVTNTIGEIVTVEEISFYEHHHIKLQIGEGLIYDGDSGKWAEIIKEETNMQKQKLSRKGLKEIHSIACSTWKNTLEQYGSRNPLEDYIELSQKEIDTMFLACTKEQLPIVSKYLKQDDGSVNLSEDRFVTDYVTRRVGGEYENKAFVLTGKFNWEIKTDSFGYICLIPTKKKFSAEKGWVL